MRRHPSSRRLMQFYDHELDAAASAEIGAHVEHCDRCAHALAEMASVGAVVRGEVVPATVPAPRWRPSPVVARLGPAVAAVAAVAIGLVMAQPPDRAQEVAASGAGSVDTVPLPSVPVPEAQSPTASDGSGGGPTGGSADHQASPPRPVPSGSAPAATPAPSSPAPLALGVLVPGGQTGPGEPVVRAVAVALAQANAGGGVNGAALELLVGDADDPAAPLALVERGAKALVGGYGVAAPGWHGLATAEVPWFGPADVAPSNTANVVPVEIGHMSAGALLAKDLVARGHERAFVVLGTGPERDLAEGLASSMSVTTAQLGQDGRCKPLLSQAALAGADVLALALGPDEIGACLGPLPDEFPVRELAVPSTTVDVVLAGGVTGFGVSSALGAPGPDEAAPGPDRFRTATGIQRHYRALVSFGATEAAVSALRRDAAQPLRGFATGGVYRSDLLTLNPASSPPNVAVQVVRLSEPKSAEQSPNPSSGAAA